MPLIVAVLASGSSLIAWVAATSLGFWLFWERWPPAQAGQLSWLGPHA
jgi:hypothetical protein